MNSIKVKILVVFLLVSLILTITQWYFINMFLKDTLEKQLIKFITHVGEAVITEITPGEIQVFPGYTETDTYKSMHKRLKKYSEMFDIDNVLLLNSEKRVVMDLSNMFRNGEEYLMMDINEKQYDSLTRGQIKKSSLYKDIHNRYAENVYIPIINGKGQFQGVLILFASVKYFNSIVSFQKNLTYFFSVILVLMVLIIYLIANSFSNPIIRLSKVVDRIGSGELELHVPHTDRSDEVGHLADNIDVMMEKIKDRDLFMRQISAGIAHEIRNPLTAIKGNLMLIKRKLEEDPNTLEMVVDNLREVESLENLVNDFMNYAKSVNIDLKKCGLSDIIDRAISEAEPFISQKEIELHRNIENMSLRADEDHLKRAVVNVLKNAVDAVPMSGSISITTRKEEDTALIMIEDNGEGISDKELKEVFEPFNTSKATGTGLGLTIVKETIEKHKGRIVIESEKGKGTRVMINIPLWR